MFNVLVCGTPGTGKSTLVDLLKNKLKDEHKFNYVNLSKFAIENSCTCGYDETLASHDIDEDKLLDKLKPILETNKHNIVEAIEPDFLPSDLFHLVFVCRTNNTILYDRLSARGYSETKISENVTSEIFQQILDEAREFYNRDQSMVIELLNDHDQDLNKNVQTMLNEIGNRLNLTNVVK